MQDFKIKQKRFSPLSIPYARTTEDDVESIRSPNKRCSIFTYKTTFFTLLLSISLVVCFVFVMIYLNIESASATNQLESTTTEEVKNHPDEKPLVLSQISLSMDPETKDMLLAMETEDKLIRLNEYSQPIRFKRQLPQKIIDCKAKQQECDIVLNGVRGITKSVEQKLNRLHHSLIQHGILKDSDSKDAKFRKIVECLQCRNAISNHQVTQHLRQDISSGSGYKNLLLPYTPPYQHQQQRNSNDRISDVLPYLENNIYPDDDAANMIDINEERGERVPKAPFPAVSKQILQSKTNYSKLASNGAKITEIIHNTTIVEHDDGKSDDDYKQNDVDSRLFSRSSGTREAEFQVTRNDGTPIIFPTAETTKTSQQIQFTPQSSWPTIPVCFYGPPSSFSSSDSYQHQQPPGGGGLPFFQQPQPPMPPPAAATPYGQQGGMNPPNKFLTPNGQPAPFSPNFSPFTPPNFSMQVQPNFQPPSQMMLNFPQSQMPPNFPQMPPNYPQPQMMNPPPRGNTPYYICTYIPASGAPGDNQLQQPSLDEFQRNHVGSAKPNEADRNQQIPQSKSTYDSSDEKYYVSECPGFWCNPPYRKCIETHERCDGKVDCMGAEDEIDCPYVGYYSRFNADPQLQSPNEQFDSANTVDGEDDWRKPFGGQNQSDIFQLHTTLSTPTDGFPFTDNEIIETTTFSIPLPDLPPQFICTRIMQTIPLEKRCDMVPDCQDASDEEGCTCRDYLQHERPNNICDGHADCPDGSDESECGFCNEDQYHCHRSGDCIPKQKRCDQTMDCSLNEDELDCFALTDGQYVNLDLDKRPHLNIEGVLTRYDNGVWRPSCFKPEYRNASKRVAAGQKICEYLGFKNVDTVEEIMVQTSKLTERHHPVYYVYNPALAGVKREANNTCYGLHIRCKPILDRKVNVHLRVDPKTKERNYLWPWEASIFVDGRYHCAAVLLEKNLLMGSSDCGEDIDLPNNYTTATFGASSEDLPFDSAHQQTAQVIDVRPLKNSDASLFRLGNGVNMTRYVQPLYLEKRIFPPAEDDTCVAVGTNDRHERKMQFLQPIIDNCPKCHRCYVEKPGESTCSKGNETIGWSGVVACLSSGGWYPAAVFQDKDQNCGFSNKQILDSIDYIHAHMSQAIDEKVEQQSGPQCNGIRCSRGQCVPWNKVCDGVRDCRNGMDESQEYCQKMNEGCDSNLSECKCSKSELRCSNGMCKPKETFCDGRADCPDGSDEPANCSCAEYLKLTEPKRVCDGRRHCLDKSDENYHNCLCKDSSFKCFKSSYNGTEACVPQDFVCDGEHDCPLGEDEDEEVCWSIKSERNDPKGKGEVMRRDFGVLQSECFNRPVQSQREVTNICARLGFNSGLLLDGSQTSDSQYVARNDFYMFQLNNYTWLSMRDDTPFGIWQKPESTCYRLFVQCI